MIAGYAFLLTLRCCAGLVLTPGIIASLSFSVFSSLVVFFSFAAAILPVRITTISGETVDGNLQEINPSAVTLDQNGTPTQLPTDSILTLQPAAVQDGTSPTMRVTLAGGSRIAAQDLALADEVLTIEPRRQPNLRVPLQSIKTIRFRAPLPTIDPQWLGMLDSEGQGDLLAVRRGVERLEPIRGLVESIGETHVGFVLGGETVEAPLDRLEGIVFASVGKETASTDSGSSAPPAAGPVQVVDIYGSHWMPTSISLDAANPDSASEADSATDERMLQMKLSDSLSHAIPLSQIESIRWSGGLMLLASQTPADRSYQPYIDSAVDPALLLSWFGPSPDGEADLIMQGGASVQYRIEPGFRTFKGSVRRDASVDRHGDVRVEINLDGKTVWNESLNGHQPSGFEIPVEQARRLTIRVVSGDDGDVGDKVRISRPRLQK